ncbi:NAC transcription factor 25-like [Cucurbita moschata]|uniref:NAC transcription factor 25-like n=1 Tax=Cucurbita moschata TaxID=3662 RepID=A0A6J1HIZ2_CUCMO|nr:NAC transcription factor 25-like [Cucurbita moschata]
MDSHDRPLLPVGVRFRPTDQQLLQYLLWKIHDQPYFKRAVLDCDLYGDMEPWEIWLRFGGTDGENLYFFTKLKRSTNNSGRLSVHINRKVGLTNGTWSGENSANPIFAAKTDKTIIGYCKRFRYENAQLPEHHGEWIMHEYSLHQDSIQQANEPEALAIADYLFIGLGSKNWFDQVLATPCIIGQANLAVDMGPQMFGVIGQALEFDEEIEMFASMSPKRSQIFHGSIPP